MFDGQNILISGGTGSFGQAFTRHLLKNYHPTKVVILSRDDTKQHDMRQRFNDSRLRFQLGDVRELERLRLAFTHIDVVIHAASLKHVPAGEHDPWEFTRTIITGTENVTRAVIDCGVERCLLLSTDKACQPVTLYGAAKLCAEKTFLAAHAYGAHYGPRFAVTRYGNVMGSRGSVIPLFRKLAREGKPLPITHSQMSRFFMLMDDPICKQALGAVQLVDYALHEMEGGEIYIPKLPSFWVRDLASAIRPEGELTISGIRGSEKMAEALLAPDEARNAEVLERVFVLRGGPATLEIGEAYTSDGNEWWYTVEDLKRELEKI